MTRTPYVDIDWANSRIAELERALKKLLAADDERCRFKGEGDCECDACVEARQVLPVHTTEQGEK